MNGDYISSQSVAVLFFSPDESQQSFTVEIVNDEVREDTEVFFIELSLPSNTNGVVLDQTSATIHIIDDDCEWWLLFSWTYLLFLLK